VFTTGQLQQWVHQQKLPMGRRALIVGAEHVSYSAVLTLREAGVRTVALVTEHPRTQTFQAFDLLTRFGLRVPVWTGASVAGIYGRGQVDRVLIHGPGTTVREVAVDTVVFTGDWIPDNELARLAGLSIDPGTLGPACDAGGATSVDGYFAAGNLVHPVETADMAARRAVTVGAAAAAWLRQPDGAPAGGGTVPVRAVPPLLWVSPNLAGPGREPGEPVLVRSNDFLKQPRIQVTQGTAVLASYGLRRMIPNRSHRIPSDWQHLVDPRADKVRISVSARP
jgi:hypothetical protein